MNAGNCPGLLIVCAIGVALSAPSAHGQGNLSGPVAIGIGSTDYGLVLDRDGHVTELDVTTGRRGKTVVSLPAAYSMIDVGAGVAGGVAGCLTVTRESPNQFGSWLVALFGKPQWLWRQLSGAYTGCVVDNVHNRILVAAAATNDIAEVNYSDGTKGLRPRYYLSLPGMKRAGPIAINANGTRLWVADLEDSKIVRVDLMKRTIDATISIDADIRAIAVDREERVYIADSAGRQVLSVDNEGAARRYAKLPEFKEPSGVAVDSKGRVWVCDQQARAVFLVSAGGSRADLTTRW
jgi:DNA-binding beta-propeller fold protein YncE